MSRVVTLTKANRAKVLKGWKTATTRRYKFEVGQVFPVGTESFEITSREYMRLDEVAEQHFEEEGFDSPNEFRKSWTHITNSVRHRYATEERPFQEYVYDPEEKVYFHKFKKIQRLELYGEQVIVRS